MTHVLERRDSRRERWLGGPSGPVVGHHLAMRHTASGLSLVTPSADGVTVAVGAGHCLRFTDEGVMYGFASAPVFEPWSKVLDLQVIFPAARARSWGVFQAVLDALAPVNMRFNPTRLELETLANGRRFFELGYPDDFGAFVPQGQALAVEAAIDRLSQRDQLRRLGEPDFMEAILDGLPAMPALLASMITWRVNRHVDSVLAREQGR